jgi:hypothetical protein
MTTQEEIEAKIRDFEQVEDLLSQAETLCKKYDYHFIIPESAKVVTTILNEAYIARSRLVRGAK